MVQSFVLKNHATIVYSRSVCQIDTKNTLVVYTVFQFWFKHILLVNTKGSGVAKLRRKPSPTYTHTFTPLNTYTKK